MDDFGADFLKLHSGDATDEANRPQLVIEYYISWPNLIIAFKVPARFAFLRAGQVVILGNTQTQYGWAIRPRASRKRVNTFVN